MATLWGAIKQISDRLEKLEAKEKAPPSFEGEPKTTDYCEVCGESPDSGTHIFNHKYVRTSG